MFKCGMAVHAWRACFKLLYDAVASRKHDYHWSILRASCTEVPVSHNMHLSSAHNVEADGVL